MRNERKRKRSFLARFMVFMMIINLLSGVNPSVVRAEENVYFKNGSAKQKNGITISKDVVKYDSDKGEYEIELKVKGSTEKIQDNIPLDVVLVVDTSGSMKGAAITNAKNAAKKFVKTLLDNKKNIVKIGLVSFAKKGEIKSELSDDINSLNNAIDKLTAYGGTYTQDGLEKAKEILIKEPNNHKKIMVVIGDGEPTLAKGTHPDFNDGGFEEVKKGETREGYEQWYGNFAVWLGKGHSSKFGHKNYLVKLIEGEFGNGSKERAGWGHVSWPYDKMDDYFENATVKATDPIKGKVDIITVGIGLEKNKLAKSIMNKLATTGQYMESGTVAEKLDNILSELVEKFQKRVIAGKITDSMSQYVELVQESAKLEGNVGNSRVVVSEDNTLSVEDVNLGEDEELILKYSVKLKEEWKDGNFYPANGKTTIKPNNKVNEIEFNVPEVRADEEKITLTVNKTWIGEAPVASVTFNIKAGSTKLNDTVVVKKDDSGNWTGKLDNLPKYKEGKAIQYTVEEVKGNNYQLKGEIEPKTDNNGNFTFTATNQNTEKVNITVTKKWVKTPDEYKKDINVVIYSKAEGETEFKEGESKTLSKSDEDKKKTLFTNLPKYNEAGKLIEYKVEEEGTDKEGKLKIGDNSFKVDVEQSKNNNYDWTITNTCDPIEKNIKFTLVKKWDKKPDEKVKATFNLIAKVNNKEIGRQKIYLPVKLQGADQSVNTQISEKGKTWTTVIEPYKYDSDNNLIEYTIEEEKLNAYASAPTGEVKVVDGKTITFYNTRIMRTLTLEKKWVGNPGNQAEFTLSGNGNEVITLNDANNWKAEKDLPVYDLEGRLIEYTITEKKIEGYKAVPENETFTFVGNNTNNKITDANKIFTNTKMLDPNKPFTVHKKWDGTPASSVSFGLYDGKNQVDKLTLNSKNTQPAAMNKNVWTGTFTKELPEYKLDENGKPVKINYVVKELNGNYEPVENGGTVSLEGRTYRVESNSAAGNNIINFTNTDITTGEITYTKEWKGEKSDGASFGLFIRKDSKLERVTKDNEKIPAVSADEGGKITFRDVDIANYSAKDYVVRELNKEGKPVDNEATIELNDTTLVQRDSVVKKYKVTYDDDKRIITNTELIDLTVKKEWGKNVPDIAKHSVKFRITADSHSDMNGKSFELNVDKGWKKDFTELPLYDVKGEKINYTVVETEINGDKVDVGDDYTKYHHSAFEINVDNAENITKSQTITIKNSIVNVSDDDSENRTINVVKGWSAGAKRKPVTVKLYQLDAAEGEIVPVENGEAELREDNHWQTKFEVPKKDKEGKEILYYAFETAVGNATVDESKLSPNMYNEGYQIGEYEVSIAELTSDEEGAEIGNYGFYILNTAHNKEVKPEEKVTINVKKKWLVPTYSEYVKPVKVRLFTKKGEYLIHVSDVKDLTLDANNNLEGKFTDLDKYNDDDKEIEYYVAEVGIGYQTKEIINFADLFGYSIGRYNVTIDGNGTNDVVITNDVALIKVKAVKNWIGATPRQTVEFTLYTKQGENLAPTDKTVTLNGTDEDTVATFAELPRLDDEGNPVVYYVYETRIGTTPITLKPTTEEKMNYSVDVSGGKYSVEITDNGTNGDKVVIISNTFNPNPVGPVIPGGDTPVIPGGTPIIPPVAPTPNPSTPVVDVPDDSTPQGPSSPGNNSGEDGNTNGDEDDGDDGFEEIDEDEVPQDGNIDNTDDADDADDNNEEETTDIADNKAPKGTPKLPKTGGETGDFLSIIGLGLIGLGLVIRRRR